MIKVSICCTVLVMFWASAHAQTKVSSEDVVFVGTLQAISPDTGMVSGDLAVYRLAKYHLERLCRGQYTGKEIVVDHLIVTGKELEGVKVGDRVYVSVKASKTVLARFNAEAIRKQSDVVKLFFIADKITTCNQTADCEPCPIENH